MTVKADVPRTTIDVATTVGGGTNVAVKGMIKDGVLGVLVVLKVATMVAGMTVRGSALLCRVPFVAIVAVILLVFKVANSRIAFVRNIVF